MYDNIAQDNGLAGHIKITEFEVETWKRKGHDFVTRVYELGKKNACTYCPYITVCGFDRKIPGYEFHRLPSFSESDLWKKIMKEDE